MGNQVRPLILLVEDTQDIADVLEEWLSYWKSRSGNCPRVRHCRDGMEAWEALHQGPSNAMISDVHMPKMCGDVLLRRMRADAIVIPVLLSSAAADRRSMKALADELDAVFLPKPIDLDALDAWLDRTLP